MPHPATLAPEPTQDRITAAAAALFHEKGYAATSISDIVSAAGVRSGSLYHFFQSKEALLLAVLRRYLDLLGPVVMAPVEARSTDPIERVFALMGWYREFMWAARLRRGCPVGNLALEVSDTNPAARALAAQNFAAWASHVERWLTEARDRLPAGADPRALSRFVLTVMEGAVMQAKACDDLAPFDESIEQLRAHFHMLEEAAQAERAARGGRDRRPSTAQPRPRRAQEEKEASQ